MKRLGFVLASIHTGSSINLLPAVIRDATRLELPLYIFPGGRLDSRPDQEYLRNGIYRLANPENIDGLVCWGSSLGGAVPVSEVDRFHRGFDPLPYVTIAHKMEGHPCVSFDAYGGMKALVRHFTKVHGARKIAFLRGPETHASSLDRFNGYRDALRESGLPDPAGTPLVSDPFPWSSGEAAIEQLYSKRGLIPGRDFDTLVCSSDMMAFAAVRWLERFGYRVPDDYRVGGFNDSQESRILSSPFTTVHMPYKDLGSKSIELLLTLLEDHDQASRGETAPGTRNETTPEPASDAVDLLLETEPVIRESCGCSGGLSLTTGLSPAAAHRQPPSSVNPRIALGDGLASIFHLDPGDREALLNPVIGALYADDLPLFYRLLEKVLSRFFEVEGDIAVIREAIHFAFTPGYLPIDPKVALETERRVHYVVGKVQHRLASLRQYETGRRQAVLNSLKNDLLCARDRDSLVPILARHLPGIGMDSVAVVLHEGEELSRSLGWFCPEGLFPARPEPFPSRRLLPAEAADRFASGVFMVQPLFMENQPLGYIVHNVPFDGGGIFEELRSAIGSALKGIFLFEETLRAKRVAEEAELAKTEFFSRIGSDLVDPLETILEEMDSLDPEHGSPETKSPSDCLASVREAVAAHLERTKRYIDVTLSLTNELALDLKLLYLDSILPEAADIPPVHGDRERLERAFRAVKKGFDGLVTVTPLIEGIGITFSRSTGDESSAARETTDASKGDLMLAERTVLLHGGDFSRDADACRILLRWPTLSGLSFERSKSGERKAIALPGAPPRLSSSSASPFGAVFAWTGSLPAEAVPDFALLWNAEGAALEDRLAVLSLRHHPEAFNAPFVYEGPRIEGESLFAAIEATVKVDSRGPVLFIALDPADFPLWYEPGQALSIPSMERFGVTVESVEPSLVVLANANVEAIARIRANAATVHVPVAVLPERIESESEIAELSRQPLVILCNRGVARSVEVSRRMRGIAAGKDVLPPHTGALVKRAILYMNLHFNAQIARWKLADTVNVSEDYLTRIFHREIGLSLWEYLTRHRIFLATELLLHTNDTINEISQLTGFQDQAYFCRVFKKIHGVPPGRIRSKRSE